MARGFLWLVLMGIVLQFLVPPVYAAGGWQTVINEDKARAAAYIHKLKEGADPSELQQPVLRGVPFRRGYVNYRAKREIMLLGQAMDEAEALAKAGKRDQIKELEVDQKGASSSTGETSSKNKSGY